MEYRSFDELTTYVPAVRGAPANGGVLELIVARPAVGERAALDEGRLDVVDGLIGDSWRDRPSSRMPDGQPHPGMQITIMNSRAIDAIAGTRERWALAGDQLYADLDVSVDNLPDGTRLAIGEAVVEVTDQPHRGCAKFADRFGSDAVRFVNTGEGAALRLRGINTKVISGGTIRPGDTFTKIVTS